MAEHAPHGRETFRGWGWRTPFLVSVLLLGVSAWIRLQMKESPAFKKMKEEGTGSKAPLSDAFGQCKNAKVALLAVLGLVMGQAVVWYTGQFYALFFLGNVLKVDGFTTNMLIAWSLLLGFDIFREQPAVLIGILTLPVIYVTMVYGPIAAALVGLFPTRIRYTSTSQPYHIGNGRFGGLLPATSFAMIAQAGDVYFGLWYPVVIASRPS